MVTEIEDEEKASTDNFESLIDENLRNQYVAGYLIDTKPEAKDSLKILEYRKEQIRDLLYNILRIQMSFYELTGNYKMKLKSVLSLIEYFKKDIKLNSQEVIYLIKLAREMILGSQPEVRNFSTILEGDMKVEQETKAVLKLIPKNPIRLLNEPEDYESSPIHISPSLFEKLIKLHIKAW